MEEFKITPNTKEFIDLVKAIIEYYASTKSKENKKSNNDENEKLSELDEASKLLESLGELDISGMAIEVPNEINESIKNNFLCQLKFYESNVKLLNSRFKKD